MSPLVAKTSEFATHECLSFVVKTSMIYGRPCGQVFTTEKRNPASGKPVVWPSGRLRTCRYPTASESKPGIDVARACGIQALAQNPCHDHFECYRDLSTVILN